MRLGLNFLERFVRTGTLYLYMPDGKVQRFGDGEPVGHMHIKRRAALIKMLLDPQMAVGTAYVKGDWHPGEGGMLKLLEVLFRNIEHDRRTGVYRHLKQAWSKLRELNSTYISRRRVGHHYDLNEKLFRRFLDVDMQYSCAYFEHPDMSLEQAQAAKCRHVAEKVLLKPGDSVLDIGSGWGGLALHMARNYDVRVTGLTLSEEQLRVSRQRAEEAGLTDKVRFLLQDYRQHEDRYDAIVSVGMFEHVGRPQYQTFFDTVAAILKPEGRVLMHTIGRSGAPTTSRHWITRYIFPGGYIPALSEVALPIERSTLVLNDLEVLRTHYADTLMHWHRRFQANREAIAQDMGEEFCRMWEFYLQVCEAVFRWYELVVFQFQLGHHNMAAPRTRDYLYEDRQDKTMAGPRPVTRRSA